MPWSDDVVSVVRILSVSDKVEPVLYGPYIRDRAGAIDLIVDRREMQATLARLIRTFTGRPFVEPAAAPGPAAELPGPAQSDRTPDA